MQNIASASALLLLALAGGFLFTYQCHAFSYQAARVGGQRLLFVAAGWAVALLIWSQAFLLAIRYLAPESVLAWISRTWSAFTEPVYGPALAVFFGALVWGPILAWLVNLFYRPKRAAARAIRKYGGELEKLAHRAWSDELLVSITLENQKVYVGWPVFTPDPRRNTEDLRLLPAVSGYRNDKTLELTFTTQYFPAYRLIAASPASGLRASDFEIVIPLDKLISINMFSLEIPQSIFEIPSEQTDEPQAASQKASGLGSLTALLGILVGWVLGRRARLQAEINRP